MTILQGSSWPLFWHNSATNMFQASQDSLLWALCILNKMSFLTKLSRSKILGFDALVLKRKSLKSIQSPPKFFPYLIQSDTLFKYKMTDSYVIKILTMYNIMFPFPGILGKTVYIIRIHVLLCFPWCHSYPTWRQTQK